MTRRAQAALAGVALAASTAWATWMWWPVMFPPASSVGRAQERWIAPPPHSPGFEYRPYVVTMANGDVYHVEGTHYYWRQGLALEVKDGARDGVVWSIRDPGVVSIHVGTEP